MRLLILIATLLTVGGGYGPPAPPIAATARPATGGHVIAWEVSDDADGWRIVAGDAEVWRAPWYLHPGITRRIEVAGDLWRPGEALVICAAYVPDGEFLAEHCQSVTPRLVLLLPQVHR